MEEDYGSARQARNMCLEFADLEKKLGEIDRARALYGHSSQICDSRTDSKFWDIWKEFDLTRNYLKISTKSIPIGRPSMTINDKKPLKHRVYFGRLNKKTKEMEGLPYGIVNVKIFRLFGDKKPKVTENWEHAMTTKISPAEFIYSNKLVGKKVWYRVCYVDENGKTKGWSGIKMAVIK
jgi:pre-mRNA-splicing factor SYF1